jgi:hypothetical protein
VALEAGAPHELEQAQHGAAGLAEALVRIELDLVPATAMTSS